MNTLKKEWLSLTIFVLLAGSFVWDHYQRTEMKNLVSEVCLEGLKVGAIKQQAIFLEIERFATDEGTSSPKANLMDIANLAKKAQSAPTEMDQAIEHFVECNKIIKK